MARPTKLDEKTIKAITEAIAAGCSREGAAAIARVAPATLYDWLARGKRGEPVFSEFLESVKKAEGELERECLSVIKAASFKGTWTASAWLLERRWPELWGRLKSVEEPAKQDEDLSTSDRQAKIHKLQAMIDALNSGESNDETNSGSESTVQAS